jgi:endoglucanase
MDFRVSHKGLGGKFRAYVDGVDKTGQLQVPDTLAWNAFQNVTKTGVNLTAGQHIIRLGFDTAGTSGFAGNFNYFRLTPTTVSMTTTLTNSTSAYVRGGSFAGSNFGSDSTLVAKKHSTLDGSREIYLSFDLSSVSTIASGKLRLYGSLNDTSSASVQTQVFGGAATAWSENSLTWNNKIATVGSALSTATVTGTTKKWYELDVTSFLKSEKAAGRNVVTLVLKNPTQQNALVVFNSDDAASNKPQLVIT